MEKCNIVEFTQIIRKVISNRKDTTYNESNYETKLAIGEIYKELDDDNKWSNWKFSLIPEPNSEFYDKSWFVGNGEPFIQMGFCENCELNYMVMLRIQYAQYVEGMCILPKYK
ncbi:MAG: hypothetical protein U0457_19930 [Candidatus Sericytochromatia bacterium]